MSGDDLRQHIDRQHSSGDRAPLGPLDKALPEAAAGRSVAEFLAGAPRLSAFSTPCWCSTIRRSTTTSPRWPPGAPSTASASRRTARRRWRRRCGTGSSRAGAWGITRGDPSASSASRVAFGVRRVQLANALVDPAALAWVSRALDADPACRCCPGPTRWTPSPRWIAVLCRCRPTRPLPVLVELGAAGGRTGARDPGDRRGRRRGRRRRARTCGSAGSAGYEGALAHDASDAGARARPHATCDDLATCTARARSRRRYEADEVVVTAGGSAYFDVVADVLGACRPRGQGRHADAGAAALGRLRGPRRRLLPRHLPVRPRGGTHRFASAMHAWTRVVSRPEPGLALLDAGKRDVPVRRGTARTAAGRRPARRPDPRR